MIGFKWSCLNDTCEFTTYKLEEFIEHLKDEHDVYIDCEIGEEWTRISVENLKPDLNLAGLSFWAGEVIAEDVARGAREFLVKIEKDRLTIVANKGGLDQPMGYDAKKLFKSLFQ